MKTSTPSFSYLPDLRSFFSLDYKAKYKNITIRLGSYIFKSPSLKIIKQFKEDQSRIEEILNHCFINSEAMWQDLSFEESDYCIGEFEHLEKVCEKEINEIVSSERDSDRFYKSMLLSLKKSCKESIRSLSNLHKFDMERLEYYSRPEERITEIIGNFRKRAYSMIHYLIDILPENNRTKIQSYNVLRAGEKILNKIYRIKRSEILEPEMRLG